MQVCCHVDFPVVEDVMGYGSRLPSCQHVTLSTNHGNSRTFKSRDLMAFVCTNLS